MAKDHRNHSADHHPRRESRSKAARTPLFREQEILASQWLTPKRGPDGLYRIEVGGHGASLSWGALFGPNRRTENNEAEADLNAARFFMRPARSPEEFAAAKLRRLRFERLRQRRADASLREGRG